MLLTRCVRQFGPGIASATLAFQCLAVFALPAALCCCVEMTLATATHDAALRPKRQVSTKPVRITTSPLPPAGSATPMTQVAIGWTSWSSPSQDSSVSVKRVRQRLNPWPPSAPCLLRRSELLTRCFPSNLRRLAPDLLSFHHSHLVMARSVEALPDPSVTVSRESSPEGHR